MRDINLFDFAAATARLQAAPHIKGEHYPHAPGYKADGTSKDAAESMAARAPRMRDACLAVLARHPATADEVAAEIGESVLAVRPRISELVMDGKLLDTGERRKNASGRPAIVWCAA